MAELPSGAVTFVHTDVEGSTALLKQLRERYAEGLATHQRLVREAFARHGGHELDTQGDAFFYAFARARDAVLAAVDAQRSLRAYDAWPDGAEFKIRIGIHTGQAEVSEGRYTGLAVHRAARICAAAHGGQVLVSQATETLLADEEQDLQVNFRPLGQRRLKDLDRPVSLYQVGAADLPSKFPPPREQAPGAAPWLRRPVVLVPAALVLAAIAAAVAVLVLGSGGGGLSGVDPNNVGVIDAKTNEIVAQVPVGIRPGPIAAGPSGVWVGNLEDRTLTRIDPTRRTQTATVSLENRTPTGLAVSDDAVWVAHGLLQLVSRVDPQYNRVVRTIATPEASGAGAQLGSGSVAVGGGSVWALFGELFQIDPTDDRVVGRGLTGTRPSALVYADGDVWVVNTGDSNVARFSSATFEDGPAGTPRPVGVRPSSIAFGEDGLWVANSGDEPGTVSRLDPATLATRSIDVGARPVSVAVGGGAVWVANAGDGTISRIDPAENAVVETIRTGNVPEGLVFHDGLLWVSVQAP